jgi:hypothetical protein
MRNVAGSSTSTVRLELSVRPVDVAKLAEINVSPRVFAVARPVPGANVKMSGALTPHSTAFVTSTVDPSAYSARATYWPVVCGAIDAGPLIRSAASVCVLGLGDAGSFEQPAKATRELLMTASANVERQRRQVMT